MTIASLLLDSARYNAWANRRFVEWLKTHPAQLMEEEVPSSFSSIKATLVHIWDTERFWFSVLKQEPPLPSFRMNGFHGSLEEVFEGIVAQSEAIVAYLETADEATMQETIVFESPWVSGTRTRAEFTHHSLCHSIYHRGQVVTIGRNIGITDAPMSDYAFYLLVG